MPKINRKKNLKVVYNIIKNMKHLETDIPSGLQVIYGKYYEMIEKY